MSMRSLASIRGSRRLSQRSLVFAITAVVTAGLVIGPLVVLIVTSLQPESPVTGERSGIGLDNFDRALGAPDTLELIRNTIAYAGGSVVLGLVLSTGLAWLTERTDLPGRRTVRTLMFVSMSLPPLMLAFGWILLLNPNNGVLNVWLRDLGFDSPFSVYSLAMMVVISGLSFTPTMFVMLSGVMRNMDPRLESAGLVSGANRKRVLRQITFPLVRPGVLSVAIYLFMIAIQVVETPLAIGITADVPVVSTRIFLMASPEAAAPQYGVAAAFGVVLLVMAVILLALYYRATRRSERFRVVSGKGYRPQRAQLGRWRYPALAGVWGYFGLMAAPVLILAWASLTPFYQVPSWSLLSEVSFANYVDIINDSVVRESIKNTVVLVLSTATLTMLLASVVSWFATRRRTTGTRLLEGLAFSPLAVPQIVLATALLVMFAPTVLHGTVLILVMGLTVVYLPFGIRTMGSVFVQVNEELEHAATVSGAGWGRMFRRIMLPLLRPQLTDGWLWVAAHALRDLTIPLTLLTGSNIVVASALWQMWNFPDIPGASALGMLMILGCMLLVVPAQLHLHRRERRLESQATGAPAGVTTSSVSAS